jgi:hypothetical protein
MPFRLIYLLVSDKIVTQYVILNVLIPYLEGTTDVTTPSEGIYKLCAEKDIWALERSP